ncbi:pks3 [Symbiodinium natans]|uniref:Pks3 protein n=1 Tax=Symbiodinium natans TaxID=878477 RepID=A0A812NPW2_9DINO|nr:pks3 [Symbiodinium natans]
MMEVQGPFATSLLRAPPRTFPSSGQVRAPERPRRSPRALALGLLAAYRHRGRRCARTALEPDEDGGSEASAPSSACITPIGPFCPYRSSACAWDSELSKGMSDLTKDSPEFAVEMGRMQLDVQMGREPDAQRMGQLADKLEQSYEKWNGLMARLRLSSDFQSREYFKLTMSHLDGRSMEDLGKMVKYQIDCMRAVATGGLIPPMPAGVDMTPPKEGLPSAAAAPPSMTAEPFDSSAFTNDVVKEEYAALCRDHRQVINMGESYGNFDPLGKIAFLDQLEKIEERWDIFFGRLGLLGALSPEYKEQSEEFLSSMGLSGSQLRWLHKEGLGFRVQVQG